MPETVKDCPFTSSVPALILKILHKNAPVDSADTVVVPAAALVTVPTYATPVPVIVPVPTKFNVRLVYPVPPPRLNPFKFNVVAAIITYTPDISNKLNQLPEVNVGTAVPDDKVRLGALAVVAPKELPQVNVLFTFITAVKLPVPV